MHIAGLGHHHRTERYVFSARNTDCASFRNDATNAAESLASTGWYDAHYKDAMNIPEAVATAEQILDEERIFPTVVYGLASPAVNSAAPTVMALGQRVARRRDIQERPENFIFRSTNFDLLGALLDQVPQQDKSAVLVASLSRISSRESYRDTLNEISRAGQWRRCSSELPLVAEFNVRRGDKQSFIATLKNAALSPGLTLLLVQLGEMIALNFTLFTDEEYWQIETAVKSIGENRQYRVLLSSRIPSTTSLRKFQPCLTPYRRDAARRDICA
jgi:hypothetical protein